MTFEYILAVFVVVMVPGTGVIYSVSIGLIHKRTTMLYAALGCTLSITPHLLACIFGLAAILNSSVLMFTVLKVLGVLYLLYMAINLYRDKAALEIKMDHISVNNFSIAKKGFLINFLNPKLSVFFLAFIPQFISKTSIEPMTDMAILGSFFMLVTFIVFVIYGAFAHLFQKKLVTSQHGVKTMQKIFAFTFALLAIKMATL